MAGDDLKLLGFLGSPFSLRVQLALNIKGLSYEYVEEDLKNKSDLLLTSNPVHKKIPVLIHNGKPVCESQIILQYIDEAFAGTGPALLPTDPYERAIVRFWTPYVDDKLLGSWLQSFRGKTELEKAEGLKQTHLALEHLEAAFKEISKGKPFFGGDTVGYLDVALGCLAPWGYASEKLFGFGFFDTARSPLLHAWRDRFVALDAVKTVLPDPDRLVEFARKMQAEEAAKASNN